MTSVTSSTSRVVTDSPVVVALDYNNRDAALAFVDGIDPRDCRLKVGKEMFTLFGRQSSAICTSVASTFSST